MKDEAKTKEQLMTELSHAREKVAELERSLSVYHEADESSRMNEEMFNIYFELSNDFMFSYNNQLQVLYVSPNIERITGYRPEDLIGRSFDQLQMMVPPEDMEEVIDNAQHNVTSSTVYPNIYRFVTKDGRERLLEVEGFPVVREDSTVAVVSMAKDITRYIETEISLREREQKYREPLRHMPGALCIIRREDARYLYANDFFFTMTGYSPDEVIGQTIYDLELPLRHEDYGVFVKSFIYGNEIPPVEHLCRRKDGSVFETLLAASPIHFGGQESLVAVLTDLTPLKQKEQEEKRIQNELELFRRNQALQTLARGVAHDMGNILTSIMGYTRMAGRDVSKLMKGNDDISVIKEDLREIRAAANRGADIVNRVQAYSQYSSAGYVPTQISSVVRESLNAVHSFLPGNIEMTPCLMQSGTIMGNPVQIHQVIINLCKNAVSAMGEAGGTLKIDLDRIIIDHDKASSNPELAVGPYVRLSVSDTGTGMHSDIQRRVYEPYFTTRWKESGSGLGLSVVYGIVKSHGGSVVCTTVPGSGTAFDIYLPEIESGQEAVETIVTMADTPRTATVLDLDRQPGQGGRQHKEMKDDPSLQGNNGHSH